MTAEADARVRWLDALPEEEAKAALIRCCGATSWVDEVLAWRPFFTAERLFQTAADVWATMEREDILEAFQHHPRIGDVEGLRKKFAATSHWASAEQSGAAAASDEELRTLANGNVAYEARFGYLFIVCATGKSAEEMLDLLEARMNNEPENELAIAAAEQAKIIRLRLEKLLSP